MAKLETNSIKDWPVTTQQILGLLDNIQPDSYAATRNFVDGQVTRLSPYISRGIISTKQVFEYLKNKNYTWPRIQKLVQELAWRDYFQRTWQALGSQINNDIKQAQVDVTNFGVSQAILQAKTGIDGIDTGIKNLYQTGYMHNHIRMYTAMLACNVTKSYWQNPAKWLYYNLIDGDWASNSLSWQWVSGSFSSKKYITNQENINKYTGTNQQNTFLDVDYEKFFEIQIPFHLQQNQIFEAKTKLPKKVIPTLDPEIPLLIYTIYNLSPDWKGNIKANRILILEPSFFEKYPSSDLVLNFWLQLAQNINDIQIFVGEFDELQSLYQGNQIFFKEHPTQKHFVGIEEARDWLVEEVSGYFPSFFGYWKKIEKRLIFKK